MTFTFYPKHLLVTAVFLVVFAVTLALAANVEGALAGAGLVSVLAYLLIELFVTFNPAAWGGARDASVDTSRRAR